MDKTKLTVEQIIGLLRHALSFIGAFLIAKGIGGEGDITLWSGIIISIVTVAFSWQASDKATRLDQLKGVLRHIIVSLSGYGVYSGIFTEETMLTILGIVFGILGGGWSVQSKIAASKRKLAEEKSVGSDRRP